MDGDGQHSPSSIPEFLEFSKNTDTEIIIGNRMSFQQKGKRHFKMPIIRLLTNKLMSLILSFICRQKIPDSQCGFRLIKREVLKRISLFTKKFEIESEILIRAARAGFKIKSLPIESIYRGERSSINPISDTFRFIRFIIREILNLTK
jgi:GT2 family glycosyltransferase